MLTSCAYINVVTRVMSPRNANTCRSHKRLMWSVNDSGMPNGTSDAGSSDEFARFFNRRSISRMSSRYSLSRVRSVAGRVRFKRATSTVTASRRLAFACLRDARSCGLLPSPNSCSKTTCGLASNGSGLAVPDHETEFT